MKNFLRFAIAMLFLSIFPADLLAGGALKFDLTRHGKMIKSAFAGVVAQSEHLVVKIEINRAGTCTGALVKYDSEDKSGLVVCKASLLGEYVSDEDRFRCCDQQKIWRSATFLGYDRELDICFLKLDLSDVREQKKIHHAAKAEAGQWLVSPGFQEKLPLGIGVLGAEPRVIDSSRGFAGLSVDETDDGLAVTKVMANSGASRAGFLTGDHLMETKEKLAQKRRWLSKLLRQYEPGDWLVLLAKRGGMVIKLDLQIGTPWMNVFERQAMMNRFGSDVSRRRTGFRSVFQHDTILHPKNCGGPIVNLKGELVGVNIARAGRTDTLAVPIQEILDTAQKFEQD